MCAIIDNVVGRGVMWCSLHWHFWLAIQAVRKCKMYRSSAHSTVYWDIYVSIGHYCKKCPTKRRSLGKLNVKSIAHQKFLVNRNFIGTINRLKVWTTLYTLQAHVCCENLVFFVFAPQCLIGHLFLWHTVMYLLPAFTQEQLGYVHFLKKHQMTTTLWTKLHSILYMPVLNLISW